MPSIPIEERAQHAPYIIQAGKLEFASGGSGLTATAVITEWQAGDFVLLSNYLATSENSSMNWKMSASAPWTLTVTRTGTNALAGTCYYAVMRFPA